MNKTFLIKDKNDDTWIWSGIDGSINIHTFNVKIDKLIPFSKVVIFKNDQMEELIDFICGNKWPEDIDELFSELLQRIKLL